MKYLSILIGALLIVTLAGCRTPPPPKQALDTAAITAVQLEIKRQVGVYMRASRQSLGIAADQFACGKGNIDFDVSTVKAELTTTIEKITSNGLKLTIPWNAVEIDPSGSVKGDATNTQVLDYNLWLADDSLQNQQSLGESVGDQELRAAPIAQVLMSLREALINGARKNSSKTFQPCFTDYDPSKPAADAGNTFKLGLTFVRDTTGGIEIKVGIIDFTSTVEWKGTTGNTLTVSFIQRGLAKLQRAREAVDAECKYPKTESDHACASAIAYFKKLQSDTGAGLFVPP